MFFCFGYSKHLLQIVAHELYVFDILDMYSTSSSSNYTTNCFLKNTSTICVSNKTCHILTLLAVRNKLLHSLCKTMYLPTCVNDQELKTSHVRKSVSPVHDRSHKWLV